MGSYYEPLAYGDSAKELQVTKRLVGECMVVAAKSSWRWALALSEATTDSGEQKTLGVGGSRALFCSIQYTGDPQ